MVMILLSWTRPVILNSSIALEKRDMTLFNNFILTNNDASALTKSGSYNLVPLKDMGIYSRNGGDF